MGYGTKEQKEQKEQKLIRDLLHFDLQEPVLREAVGEPNYLSHENHEVYGIIVAYVHGRSLEQTLLRLAVDYAVCTIEEMHDNGPVSVVNYNDQLHEVVESAAGLTRFDDPVQDNLVRLLVEWHRFLPELAFPGSDTASHIESLMKPYGFMYEFTITEHADVLGVLEYANRMAFKCRCIVAGVLICAQSMCQESAQFLDNPFHPKQKPLVSTENLTGRECVRIIRAIQGLLHTPRQLLQFNIQIIRFGAPGERDEAIPVNPTEIPELWRWNAWKKMLKMIRGHDKEIAGLKLSEMAGHALEAMEAAELAAWMTSEDLAAWKTAVSRGELDLIQERWGCQCAECCNHRIWVKEVKKARAVEAMRQAKKKKEMDAAVNELRRKRIEGKS